MLDEKVFINCPYDKEYRSYFEIIIFACAYFDFEPTFASEDPSTHIRLESIIKLIQASKLSIHDLSRIELSDNRFPRFNMPFELGLYCYYSYCDGCFAKHKMLVLAKDRETLTRTTSDLNCSDNGFYNNSTDLFDNLRRFFCFIKDSLRDEKSTKWLENYYNIKFGAWLENRLLEKGYDSRSEIEIDEYKVMTTEFFKSKPVQ